MSFSPLLLTLLPLALAAQPATPPPPTLAETLRTSRWQHRVLLVAASNTGQADFQRQKALLAADRAGLEARDFRVLDVLYEQLSAADQRFFTQKTGVRPPAFAVVLIGKDGGMKHTSARPTEPAALFRIVDQMPMRREEMRRK